MSHGRYETALVVDIENVGDNILALPLFAKYVFCIFESYIVYLSKLNIRLYVEAVERCLGFRIFSQRQVGFFGFFGPINLLSERLSRC